MTAVTKFDARLRDDREWHGYLTLANYELVADRIRRMLDGRRYTWVDVNDGFDNRPHVRTSQVAEKVTTKKIEDSELALITVVDTYGVWGLDTTAADQKAARDQPERDRTYVSFKHDQIEIYHFVPAGYRVYWVVALEDRPDDGSDR